MSDLEQRMKDVVAEAALIAEAGASKMDSSKVSSGKAGTKEPTSSGTSTLDAIKSRLNNARTDSERQRAVAWAENLVRRTKRLAPREMTVDEREFWATHKIENGAGKDYRTVAQETGLSEKTIWEIRKRAKLDPRYGTKAA